MLMCISDTEFLIKRNPALHQCLDSLEETWKKKSLFDVFGIMGYFKIYSDP